MRRVQGIAQWLHRRPALLVAAVALVIAFACLGTRALWDPDEGRYTNVALNMLDQGDWINPVRFHDVAHLTKPPLTYWMLAASFSAFGENTWAARLPVALAYLSCVWLTWRIARRLAPGSEAPAAVVFALMPLPALAAQMVTTDFILTATQTLAVASFVEARFGPGKHARAWTLVMWVAFALAFMTKGPPALLPLLAIVTFQVLVPSPRPQRLMLLSHMAVFTLVALPWYLVVVAGNPGLIDYFVGAEVIDRFAGDRFGRNAEWYGWLLVYLPTLLLGTVPWTGTVWQWLRALPQRIAGWRDAMQRQREAPAVFLALWFLVPLLVFCVARSRLPLYLLPLFVPLAIAVAATRSRDGAGLPRLRWIAAGVVLLVGLRVLGAGWPTHKDASAWADAIRDRAPFDVQEVVFVEDMARYGLHLHLGSKVEKISLTPRQEPAFDREFDEDLDVELAEAEPQIVWVAKRDAWPQTRYAIASRGYLPTPLGDDFEGCVIFTVAPRHRAGLSQQH